MSIETWGKNRRAIRNKPAKLDLIQKIAKNRGVKSLQIHGLTLKDLTTLVEYVEANPKEGLNKVEPHKTKRQYMEDVLKVLPTLTSLKVLNINGVARILEIL